MFPSNAPTSSSLLHENTEHQYLFDDVSLSPTIDHGDTFLPYDQDHLLSPHRPLFTAPSSTNGTPFLTPDLLPTPATTKDMPLFSPTHNFFPTNAPSSSLPAANGNILARKRPSKKDRHSKIYTRQGPRDRRMRLSLEIAREFFHLQDMLGFDKASKTIGWLLMNSRAKIKELSKSLSQPNGSSSGGRTKSGSSMSECEDISGIDDAIDNVSLLEKEEEDDKGAIKAKKIRQSRKAAFDPLAKVSRVMKRAKARERAKENKSRRLCGSKQCPGMCPNYANQSKSLVTIKGGPESNLPGKRDDKSSLELMAKFKEPVSQTFDHQVTLQHVVAESLPVITESGQLMFEYHHHMPQGMHSDVHFPSYQNNDMIKFFSESWNMDDARAHSGYCAVHNMHSSAGNAHDLTIPLFKSAPSDDHLQSQFTDVHFFPKSWDAYANQSCADNF